MLPAGFAIAFIAHWLPTIARLLVRFVGRSPSAHLGRLIQLTIVSVALAAWAIAEMAEAGDSARLRHAAVTVALISIGLWASVDSGATSHPLLTASMRWLVASVHVILCKNWSFFGLRSYRPYIVMALAFVSVGADPVGSAAR